jgi:hypothetical protein
MKTSLRLLLSVLAITSTMALADDPVEKGLSLEKFSYHGVGFKDRKTDLVAKLFECNAVSCKRKEKDTNIDVVFTDDRIQIIDARTRYNNRIDCTVNQREIKKFLTDTYNFEYVNQDSTFLGMNMTSNDVGGNIKTTDGSIFVNVSCMNDSKINMGYVNTRFNLKDISAQSFKDAFKYE